jgi:hypothetical protein
MIWKSKRKHTLKCDPREWVLFRGRSIGLGIFVILFKLVPLRIITNWVRLKDVARVTSVINLLFIRMTSQFLKDSSYRRSGQNPEFNFGNWQDHAPACRNPRH